MEAALLVLHHIAEGTPFADVAEAVAELDIADLVRAVSEKLDGLDDVAVCEVHDDLVARLLKLLPVLLVVVDFGIVLVDEAARAYVAHAWAVGIVHNPSCV